MELVHNKNGGRYTQDQQRKRRNEVSRLHFEYGYSARKISELLNVNRGTINRDLMYAYDVVHKNWRQFDPVFFIMKQCYRLEIQRTRLREQLDKRESFQEKMIIERLIFNVDLKITEFQMRIIESTININKKVATKVNEQFVKENIKKRIMTYRDFYDVTNKTYDRLTKVFSEDKKF